MWIHFEWPIYYRMYESQCKNQFKFYDKIVLIIWADWQELFIISGNVHADFTDATWLSINHYHLIHPKKERKEKYIFSAIIMLSNLPVFQLGAHFLSVDVCVWLITWCSMPIHSFTDAETHTYTHTHTHKHTQTQI